MTQAKKQTTKTCYCPKCGKKFKIPLGKRCNTYKCTNCGTTLSRNPSGCPKESSKSYVTKPEVTEKYIRIPTGTACKVTATITISAKKGIKALYCGKVKKIRTYLFARSKGWTMAKAKAWVKAHKSSLEEKRLIIDAEMNTPQRFKISLPIIKTRSRIVRTEDGTEKEERYVAGVASSTDIDLQGDRMTEQCLRTMADSLKTHIINLNAEHDTSWRSEIGDLEKLKVNGQKQLVCEAKLNDMSPARDLWYALTEQHKKLGLSIGGYVKEYEMAKEGEGDSAKWVRIFKEIELDHIAVTSSPANPKTWVQAITKSLDPEKEVNMIKKADTEKVKWDRAFINRLPDAAFAYIEPGGKKDETGRTKPRSLRHYPHHGTGVKSGSENNSVDKAHLRNALARCGQKTKFWQKALPHLVRHAKALGIGQYAKSLFEEFDEDALLLVLGEVLDLLGDEQLVEAIERSLNTMTEVEKKRKLRQEEEAETKKKLEEEKELEEEVKEESAEDSKEEEEKSDGEPEEESSEEAEEESKEKSEEDSDEEESDKDDTEEEEESDEKESEDEEESEEEKAEEETEEETSEADSEEESDEEESDEGVTLAIKLNEEVSKTLDVLSKKLDSVLEENKELSKKVTELEKQPAGRKVAIDKTLGDEDEGEPSNPGEAMEKEIADLKVKEANSPNLFAMIQRVRNKYAGRV